ncbi:MAG: hypothetical protein EPN30_02215 [Actinomycetota bacterium]|nr:MAG: hypothetical protein EPN30_02215 [Actinomycetota bacterium]
MRPKVLLGAKGVVTPLLLTFCFSGVSGAAHTPFMSGAVQPVRNPNGSIAHNSKNQVYTTNWSGYAVAKYATGSSYTSATASWVVPTVAAVPGFATSYSSSWVGIGGFCLNSGCTRVDKTLIQLGTEQDASSSGSTYYAWYETLPQAMTPIKTMTINPGDTIVASLADGPKAAQTNTKAKGGGGKAGGGGGSKAQTWVLTLTDNTTGGSWSTTLSYASSLASAEWIEEAPYSGGVLPLADFGTATFDPGTANGSNPSLTSSNGIVMSNPNGQTSNVSVPDSDTDGFNACWGSGSSYTSCASPTS